MAQDEVQRCYWNGGELNVVLTDRTIALNGPDGLKALKRNELVLEGDATSVPLFGTDDNARRMQLIQEKISGLRD